MLEWVKKLGQQHWSNGEGKTLCGMPLMGNNYKDVIDNDEKKPCEECAKKKADIEAGQ